MSESKDPPMTLTRLHNGVKRAVDKLERETSIKVKTIHCHWDAPGGLKVEIESTFGEE